MANIRLTKWSKLSSDIGDTSCYYVIAVVQSLSCVWFFVHSWTVAFQASLSFTILWSLLEFISIKSVMLSNISFSSAPFSFCLHSFPASGSFPMSQFFTLCGQKSWSYSISPSNEYSGLIFSRIDWFDLLAVQKTLNSLLQHHNLKASLLQHSAFFMVQMSHPYMTIRKTIGLTRWNFVTKVMSLLFNTMSRFVIAFLLRSKCLNSIAAVTIHSDFQFFPFCLPWSDGTRYHDLRFLNVEF